LVWPIGLAKLIGIVERAASSSKQATSQKPTVRCQLEIMGLLETGRPLSQSGTLSSLLAAGKSVQLAGELAKGVWALAHRLEGPVGQVKPAWPR